MIVAMNAQNGRLRLLFIETKNKNGFDDSGLVGKFKNNNSN